MPKQRLSSFAEEVQSVVIREVNDYLFQNLTRPFIKGTKKQIHKCLHCRGLFKASSKFHNFCSRRCYSKFHRIPGFIRNLIKEGKL